VLLRARASDFSLIGDWSIGTPFQVNMGVSQDSDADGIPDAWELAMFSTLTRSSLTDTDGDGMSDYAEYIADTIPTNAASYLRLTSVSSSPAGIVLHWLGGTEATQYIHWSGGLVIYSIPARGFTAAVSVFIGTPPPKPLNCKSVSNHRGALISDRWTDPTGEEYFILGAIFSFVLRDIIETSF